MRNLLFPLAISAVLWAAAAAHAAEPLPLFDAHIHYSEEAWQRMPPKEAIALLRKAGVKRALVSSSGGVYVVRLTTINVADPAVDAGGMAQMRAQLGQQIGILVLATLH